MEPGNIVEFIDRQKIMCAVVLEVKNQRLRLLTESNRETNLTVNRLTHTCAKRMDLSMGRDKLVEALKGLSQTRSELSRHIDIQELWEVLNTEQEWIDLATMTQFCFLGETNSDHESAVTRAFFENRIYFKFNIDQFFPYTAEQVAQIIAANQEAERKERLVRETGEWLKHVLAGRLPLEPQSRLDDDKKALIKILESFYIFGKESPHFEMGKAITARAGINSEDEIFNALVKLDAWAENENIDLHRHAIPIHFSADVLEAAETLAQQGHELPTPSDLCRDLTDLEALTIDGQSTLDFDDALTLQRFEDHYRLGVHIADVGYFIRTGDALDREALSRGSSIYTPDLKIPMLPPNLAEDLCSLKAGQIRPVISTLIKLDLNYNIVDYEIVSALINVKRQLTYYDVNLIADEDPAIRTLRDIAEAFRRKRLDNGAVQITLPEINTWIKEDGEIVVTRINRESPGRLLVAEIMIMANWLMAKFLAAHKIPAVFRSQADPRKRLYQGNEGSLFQNWMQRKLLSRYMLGPEPEQHSGLGLDVYVTATSPIRKYFDMVTQRQIRALLGYEAPADTDEIRHVIQEVEEPTRQVVRIQSSRHRYWVLKHLETRIGQREEALVLEKRRNQYAVLLTEYMLEALVAAPAGMDLKPQDMVQVTIQNINARKDIVTLFIN